MFKRSGKLLSATVALALTFGVCAFPLAAETAAGDARESAWTVFVDWASAWLHEAVTLLQEATEIPSQATGSPSPPPGNNGERGPGIDPNN